MSKNVVTIIDADSAARDALAICCQSMGLAEKVHIVEPGAQDSDSGPLVSLQVHDENVFNLSEADIFIKPVRVGRLLARVEYHIRRMKDSELPAQIKVGPHRLDWRNHVLLCGKEETKMTEKETAILKLLCEYEGKAVTRDVLLDAVWGYADGVETHTLETHIYRLRQKIEKDAANPKILITNDDGYILKN